MDYPIGMDVSFWDGKTIDFKKARTNGILYTIIRAGQGQSIDTSLKGFMAQSYGIMPRGFYWLLDARYEPTDQAKRFIDALDDDQGELPLVVDWEKPYNMEDKPYKKLPYWGSNAVVKFLDKLKSLTEKKIIIYTNIGHAQLTNMSSFIKYFSAFDLWVASYNPQPSLPSIWKTWLFWQFTNLANSALYGIDTTVGSRELDLNYFNGTKEALYSLANWTDGNNPTPPNPPSSITYKIKNVTVTLNGSDGSELTVTN